MCPPRNPAAGATFFCSSATAIFKLLVRKDVLRGKNGERLFRCSFYLVFVCFQVSLKSLQVYDEYGASDDPHQLQRQVRELKVQLEHQTRVVVQLQSLLRHGALAVDSAVRDQLGAQREEPGQEVSSRSGLQRRSSTGESRAVKDKTSPVSVEVERMEDRMGEQLLQNLSRSASPARSTVCLERFWGFFLSNV